MSMSSFMARMQNARLNGAAGGIPMGGAAGPIAADATPPMPGFNIIPQGGIRGVLANAAMGAEYAAPRMLPRGEMPGMYALQSQFQRGQEQDILERGRMAAQALQQDFQNKMTQKKMDLLAQELQLRRDQSEAGKYHFQADDQGHLQAIRFGPQGLDVFPVRNQDGTAFTLPLKAGTAADKGVPIVEGIPLPFYVQGDGTRIMRGTPEWQQGGYEPQYQGALNAHRQHLQEQRAERASEGGSFAQLTDAQGNVTFFNPRTRQQVAPPTGFGRPLTGQDASRALQANAILNMAPQVINEVQSIPPDQLGPLWGRVSKLEMLWGNPDPRLAHLGASLASFAALQPGLHGFRGQNALREFEKMIGGFPRTPEALTAAIQGMTGASRAMMSAMPGPTGAANPMQNETQAAPSIPDAARNQLREGFNTTFANGQVWTLKNGQAIQVK